MKKIIIRGQARKVRRPVVQNQKACVFRPKKGKGAYNRAAERQRVLKEITNLGGKIYG